MRNKTQPNVTLKKWAAPTRQGCNAALMLAWLLFCAPSQATNAPFYWWQSKVTGKLICKQTSPGEGWLRFSGPFADGGCRQAIPPH